MGWNPFRRRNRNADEPVDRFLPAVLSATRPPPVAVPVARSAGSAGGRSEPRYSAVFDYLDNPGERYAGLVEAAQGRGATALAHGHIDREERRGYQVTLHMPRDPSSPRWYDR